MKNKDKTQGQRIKELTQLRRRIAAVEESEREYKKLEKALRTERDKAQQYLDIAEVMLVVLDKKGTITLLNRKGNQILGYKDGELIGKNWFATCLPLHLRKDVKGVFQKLMAGKGKQTEFYENTILTKSGTERIIAWHNTVLKDAQGNIIGTLSSGEDITDRKRAEDSLLNTRDRLLRLLEASPAMIYSCEATGDFNATYISENIKKIMGYDPEEFLSPGFWAKNIHPEDAPRVFANIGQIFKKGRHYHEYRFRHNNDSWCWMADELKLVCDENGEPKEMIGYWRDITPHKLAEKALRESEEGFRLAFENANTGVCLVDLEGNLTRVNSKMCEIFGYTKDELESMTINDIAHPEDIDKNPAFIKKTLQGVMDRDTFEKRYIHKQGHVVTCQVSSSLVRNAEGAPLYFISHVHNITERKQAEEALRGSETRFRTLFEGIPDSVLVHDDQGNILHINEIGAERLEWTVKDLVGRNMREVVTPENAASIADHVRETHKVGWCRFETTYVSRSGWQIRAEVTERPVKFGDVKAILSVAHDITKRKQVEEALRSSRDYLERLTNSMGDAVFSIKMPERVIEWANDSFKLIGYEPGECIGRTTEFLYADKSEFLDFGNKLKKAMAAEKDILHAEQLLQRKNGEVFPTEITTTLFREQGKIVSATSIIRDITDRKQSEEELRTSEAQLSNAMEIAKLGYWEYDVAEDIFTFNDYFYEIFRTTAEKVGGYKMSSEQYAKQFIHPDDISLVGIEIRKAIETTDQNFSRQLDHRIIYADGEIGYISVRFFIVKDSHGRTVKTYGANQDITERKRAEEALREKEETIRALVETSQDWIWSIDLNGIHTYSNPAVEKILGYTPVELIGKSNLELMHDEDRRTVEANLPQWIKEKSGWRNLILRWRHKAGSWRWLESNAVPMFDAAGELIGFRGVDRDITERKQAEARAEHLNLVLLAIRGINQLITREKDRDRLIQGACDKLIETRGYDNVWIALIDESGGLAATAEAGLGESFPPLVELLGRSEPPYCMRMALTQAGALIIEDPFATCADCPLSNGYGGRRAMATRLEHDGKIYGLMTVSVSRDYVADEEEQTLFREVAEDIAFALYNIELEEKHGQAEAAVRASEERFRRVVETMKVGLGAIDENGVLSYVNEYFAKMLGYSMDEMIGRSTLDFYYDEESREAQEEIFAKRRAGMRDPTPYEVTWRKKDGQKKVYAILSPTPSFDADGRYIGSFAIHTDITERKRAEQELHRSYQQMQEMLVTTVNALASTVEMKDQYTAGHQPRVTQLACAIAEEMGLPEGQIEGIRMAGLIHDIGKIMVPAEILNKPGPLTEIQYEMVKMHPRASYDILKRIKFPWPVAKIVLQHHEWMDGSGYPQGLSGEEILLEARILAVANVVEAMVSHRPYRAAYDIKEPLAEISKNKGILYDPDVVDACRKLFSEKRFAFT